MIERTFQSFVGISPEVAEIDREREISVALISAASDWAGVESPPHLDDELAPIRKAAQDYLMGWWKAVPPRG